MTKPLDKTFTVALTSWYRENCRALPWRRDQEPYHVWVSEIMLQQTRVEAVREYYKRFMEALPSVSDLAAAEEQTLLKLWQGLGYYNRVRNMHKAATVIVREYGGKFPGTYEEIKSLPGIGAYTAGAIGSICFDLPVAAVDGNVLRVMSRVLADYGDVQSPAVKNRISARLQGLYPEKNCGEFTQSLIELGALVCIPKGQPKCEICPAAAYCKAREAGVQLALPVKGAKKERKKVEKTVFILRHGDKVAVRKRGQNVLLAGLYEFPNVDEQLSAAEAVALAESWETEPKDLLRKAEYTHVFTHVQWEMTAYYLTVGQCCPQFQWASEKELAEEIPLPSAFGYFLG